MPLSQYQMATPGVSELGNSINRLAIGMAQQKYMMEQQRQALALKQAELASDMMHKRMQEQLYGAQVKESGAQAEHYTAQANDLNQKQQAAGTMGDLVTDYNRVPQNTQADLMPLILGQAAKLSGQGQQHVPVNLAQILQMNNPRAQQMMATGTKMTANVPAGGSLYDVLNQNTMMQSPRTIPRGNVMVPGMGGAPIAEGMAPAAGQSDLLKAFGSLQSLQGHYQAAGAEDAPEYKQINASIQALLPYVMNQATNAPQPQLNVQQPVTSPSKGPAVGTISKGYKFKGGNPADKASWEKVQ